MVGEIIIGELIKEQFVNACILVTVLFLSSRIFLKIGLGSRAPLKGKIFAGILGAILAIILMFFSIKIPPYTIMDMRNIALMVVAIYAGGLATFITGVIGAFFRLFYWGISSTSAFSALTLLVLTAIFITIRNMKISRLNKWIYMYLFCCLIPSFTFWLNIKDPTIIKQVIISYCAATLFATVIAYLLTEYINKTNLHFLHLTIESSVDFLTGLKNSRSFDMSYNAILKNAYKNNENFAVLMLDIDLFKRVNDIHGHAAGDVVLRELARLLMQSTRNFDIVARIGGEEFCVVLRNCSQGQAFNIAERIRKTVEGHDFLLASGFILNLTISIGCAIYPETELDLDKVKEAADMKLYEAKRSGRNKVCI